MTIREFIRRHRHEIDEIIKMRVPNIGRLNDNDRREWIMNEEGLYRWARSEGVKI